MEAMRAHAVEDGMDVSQSLASRRHRPSHAKVRSTTQRRGKTLKPLAVSDRFMTSMVQVPHAGESVSELASGISGFGSARKSAQP